MYALHDSHGNIQSFIENFSGDVSYFIRILNTNEEISYKESELFPTASTIKVFILGCLLSEVQKGNFLLSDYIEIQKDQQVGGTGILKEFSPGIRMTIHDVLVAMIVISDNTATNMIIDLLGGVSAVNSYINKLGFINTKLINRIDFTATGNDANKLAVSTAGEFIDYLTLIHENKAFSKELKQVFLNIMSKQQDISQYVRYIPYNPYAIEMNEENHVSIASKTGSFPGVRCDVGFMTISKVDILFVVLTKNCRDLVSRAENEGSILVGKIGKEIYDRIKLKRAIN